MLGYEINKVGEDRYEITFVASLPTIWASTVEGGVTISAQRLDNGQWKVTGWDDNETWDTEEKALKALSDLADLWHENS